MFIARIKSPKLVHKEGIDLVAVLDVSGSMQGEKIQLMKDSLQYLVEQLTPDDRISLVSFSSISRRLTPLLTVTPENKINIMTSINSLRSETSTNIEEGINRGLRVLRNRQFITPVSAMFILTDGNDDAGITAKTRLSNIITNELLSKTIPNLSVYCFGYGIDHDAETLSSMSDNGNGLFYFIENISRLHEAFGKCLGGLISINAVDIILKIECNVYSLKLGLDNSSDTIPEPPISSSVSVHFPNLYAEEEKNTVFEMYLNPSVPSPVILSCSYLQLPSLTRTNISCSLIIQRSSSPLGSPNLEVDKQKNRLITSCAMKKSKVFADQEKYKESVHIIEEAILKISSSLSATDPFCINLIRDLNSLKSRLTETGYTSGGRQLLLTQYAKSCATTFNKFTFYYIFNANTRKKLNFCKILQATKSSS